MRTTLCISFRFIHPYPLFHGSRDGGEPEWPPSPLRAFQALLNAACLRNRGKSLTPEMRSALQALEVLRPHIVAPAATPSTTGFRAYVPHNHTDLVTAAWHRGNTEASIATHRTEKDHLPHRLHASGDEIPTVHYLYDLAPTNAKPEVLLDALRPAVRSITHLGWGIDQVVADVSLLSAAEAASLCGERFAPAPTGRTQLRTPKHGSLDALHSRYDRFLSRLSGGNWTPVPPFTRFDLTPYRKASEPVPRPHATFRLLDGNGDTIAYPQAKLIHIAGMVRHLALDAMTRRPPRDLRGIPTDRWIEQYVAGHRDKSVSPDAPHVQLSFIPLQSIGTPHTSPAVRRVMIVAPPGDEVWLEHLARLLDGRHLKPLPRTQLPPDTRLERIPSSRKDGVRDAYINTARVWASVTPVILPGHDDHKPEKTERLIQKALAQAGIDQSCEFEWSAFSQFRKILPAHKYVRDPSAPDGKRPTNYLRPDHLQNQTAVHLKLTFAHPVPGPLAIGPGRHCGFGLMAVAE